MQTSSNRNVLVLAPGLAELVGNCLEELPTKWATKRSHNDHLPAEDVYVQMEDLQGKRVKAMDIMQ